MAKKNEKCDHNWVGPFEDIQDDRVVYVYECTKCRDTKRVSG